MRERLRFAAAALVPAFPILGAPAALLTLIADRRGARFPMAGWLALAAALLVTSSLLGPGGIDSALVALTAAIAIGLFLGYGASVQAFGRDRLLNSLLVGGLLSAFIALARYPFAEMRSGYPRLQGILGQENLLGMQMAVSLGLLVGGANRTWPLPARLAAVALLGVVLVMAGPRAGFAAAAVAAVVALFQWFMASARARLAAAVGVVSVVLVVMATAGVFGDRLNPVFAAGQGRLAVWERTIEVIGEHPLFGVGFNQLSGYLLPEHDGIPPPPHAHNFAFHLLAEGGLVGGLPLVFLVCWAGAIAWRRWPDTRPFLAAFLVTNLVDYNLGNAYVASMLLIVLGAALARPRTG